MNLQSGSRDYPKWRKISRLRRWKLRSIYFNAEFATVLDAGISVAATPEDTLRTWQPRRNAVCLLQRSGHGTHCSDRQVPNWNKKI